MAQQPSQPRRSRPSDSEPPAPADEPSGFATSYVAPPPVPDPTAEVTPAPEQAQSMGTYVPLPQPGSPTDRVKILSPVNIYPVGQTVPADFFSPQRLADLIALHVVEYTYEPLSTAAVDETLAAGMRGVQPAIALTDPGGGIPNAPWAQQSLYDALGPAVALPNLPRMQPQYSTLATDQGPTLIVAQPQLRKVGDGPIDAPEQMAEGQNGAAAHDDQ